MPVENLLCIYQCIIYIQICKIIQHCFSFCIFLKYMQQFFNEMHKHIAIYYKCMNYLKHYGGGGGGGGPCG